MSCTSGCIDPCLPPCPPTCNCTTNDIIYKGANDTCTGVTYGEHLTDVIYTLSTFAKNRLYSILPSASIAVTPALTTCNKSARLDAVISPDAGNSLSIHSNGLYANVSGTTADITVNDTDSIDLTYTGGLLTADVDISAISDNIISIQSDGLYAQKYLAYNGITESPSHSFELGGTLVHSTNIFVDNSNLLAIRPNVTNNESYWKANGVTFQYTDTTNPSTVDPAGKFSVSEWTSNYTATTILNNSDIALSERYSLGQLRITGSIAALEFDVPTKSGDPLTPPVLPYLTTSTYFKAESNTGTIKATDLILPDILNSKDDTGSFAQSNTLYTTAGGKVCSAPFKPNLKGSASLNFANTPAQGSTELTMTVTGAAVGDNAVVNSTVNPSNSCWSAYVSAPNTVTVRFNNYSIGSIDPAIATFKATVFSN